MSQFLKDPSLSSSIQTHTTVAFRALLARFFPTADGDGQAGDSAPTRVAKVVAPLKYRRRILHWDLIPSAVLDELLAKLARDDKMVASGRATPKTIGNLESASDSQNGILKVEVSESDSLKSSSSSSDEVDDEKEEEQESDHNSEDQDEDEQGETEEEDDGEDSEEEKDEDEDDEEDDDDGFQETWGPFTSIPDEHFINLLNRVLAINPEVSPEPYTVDKRTQGSYHHVVILNNGSNKMVVKVPVVGTEERWDPGHAAILQSEADTMTCIKTKAPKFPVATVHCYDTGFDNEIGAPFILTSFLEGKPSNHIWFEETEDGEDDESTNNCPSGEREELRIAFLRSLAKTMAELRHLEFGGIGMVFFKNGEPVIGPYHGWDARSLDEIVRKYWQRPVYTTAAESYNTRLNQKFELGRNADVTGTHTILKHVYNSPPFSYSIKHPYDEKESFTLLHNDLDIQNILVNDAGEITGILDWDGCGTVPRCAGFSTVPIFLQRDWENNYDFLDPDTLSPWRLSKYRGIYAEAMKEACGEDTDDAKYTEMSGLYGVVHDVLFGHNPTTPDRAADFIEKLLREIRAFRHVLDAKKFTQKIGEGWQEAEEVLEEWVPKVLQWKEE
jgi:aminoglycoside phosphotransferase (APT) family kinase protein